MGGQEAAVATRRLHGGVWGQVGVVAVPVALPVLVGRLEGLILVAGGVRGGGHLVADVDALVRALLRDVLAAVHDGVAIGDVQRRLVDVVLEPLEQRADLHQDLAVLLLHLPAVLAVHVEADGVCMEGRWLPGCHFDPVVQNVLHVHDLAPAFLGLHQGGVLEVEEEGHSSRQHARDLDPARRLVDHALGACHGEAGLHEGHQLQGELLHREPVRSVVQEDVRLQVHIGVLQLLGLGHLGQTPQKLLHLVVRLPVHGGANEHPTLFPSHPQILAEHDGERVVVEEEVLVEAHAVVANTEEALDLGPEQNVGRLEVALPKRHERDDPQEHGNDEDSDVRVPQRARGQPEVFHLHHVGAVDDEQGGRDDGGDDGGDEHGGARGGVVGPQASQQACRNVGDAVHDQPQQQVPAEVKLLQSAPQKGRGVAQQGALLTHGGREDGEADQRADLHHAEQQSHVLSRGQRRRVGAQHVLADGLAPDDGQCQE